MLPQKEIVKKHPLTLLCGAFTIIVLWLALFLQGIIPALLVLLACNIVTYYIFTYEGEVLKNSNHNEAIENESYLPLIDMKQFNKEIIELEKEMNR